MYGFIIHHDGRVDHVKVHGYICVARIARVDPFVSLGQVDCHGRENVACYFYFAK